MKVLYHCQLKAKAPPGCVPMQEFCRLTIVNVQEAYARKFTSLEGQS